MARSRRLCATGMAVGCRKTTRARVLGIHIVWQFTQPRSGGFKKRLDDQLQFFAETMYRFNAEIARYLREDLGCKQLINAGNWKTADSIRLNDVERWSYTANEVLAVNSYYSPVHLGPDPGLTHHNSESGLAGKPCLLVKFKLLDHLVATVR